MLKKIWLGVAVFWVVFMPLGVVWWAVKTRQTVSAAQKPEFINGFPLEGFNGGVLKLPFLTKEQLVTRSHTLQEVADREEIANLLYAYGWYHDSGNGPGVLSTFTKDALEGGSVYYGLHNDNGKQIVGDGCMISGDQLYTLSVDNEGHSLHLPDKTEPLPFPGHSHNVITNLMIQLHGDTAELHAYFIAVHSNIDGEPPIAEAPKTAVVHHFGEYIMDPRRTPEGWKFTRQWHVQDAGKAGAPTGPCPAIPNERTSK